MKGKQEGDDLFDRLSVSTIFINHLLITTIDSFRIIDSFGIMGQKVIINNRQIDVSWSELWQKCADEINLCFPRQWLYWVSCLS